MLGGVGAGEPGGPGQSFASLWKLCFVFMGLISPIKKTKS